MWTSVYMAQNKEIANKYKKMIEENNIIVMLRPIRPGEDSADSECFELLVPSREHERALGIIISE